uniref:Uncharacterized protein n=1 Tax=Siphoviridae sp. ctFIm6 TaxID=2827818 RepID=A0A8S5SKF3_9CAUD|nr:MAG TPA: hypothetical protein [Siphoviridae sp. ctFIm6]
MYDRNCASTCRSSGDAPYLPRCSSTPIRPARSRAAAIEISHTAAICSGVTAPRACSTQAGASRREANTLAVCSSGASSEDDSRL